MSNNFWISDKKIYIGQIDELYIHSVHVPRHTLAYMENNSEFENAGVKRIDRLRALAFTQMSLSGYTFFFYKNQVYKNVRLQIVKNLRAC